MCKPEQDARWGTPLTSRNACGGWPRTVQPATLSCRGTVIMLNYSTVSKPDAFHARRLDRQKPNKINGE
jgi:hypothetical protein